MSSQKILWSLEGGKIDSKACALRIRERAKEIGITQAKLCDFVGKRITFISEAANGKAAIKESDLQLIAQKLETTVDYLMGKTDNPEIPELEPSQQDIRIKDVCNLLYTLTDEELCAVQAFVCGIIAGRA